MVDYTAKFSGFSKDRIGDIDSYTNMGSPAFETLLDWKKQPGNRKEMFRPISPSDTSHLDDDAAQSLQDAMRLRMQLPR